MNLETDTKCFNETIEAFSVFAKEFWKNQDKMPVSIGFTPPIYDALTENETGAIQSFEVFLEKCQKYIPANIGKNISALRQVASLQPH